MAMMMNCKKHLRSDREREIGIRSYLCSNQILNSSWFRQIRRWGAHNRLCSEDNRSKRVPWWNWEIWVRLQVSHVFIFFAGTKTMLTCYIYFIFQMRFGIVPRDKISRREVMRFLSIVTTVFLLDLLAIVVLFVEIKYIYYWVSMVELYLFYCSWLSWLMQILSTKHVLSEQ